MSNLKVQFSRMETPLWYNDKEELTSKTYKSDQQRLESKEAAIGDITNIQLKTSSTNSTDTQITLVNMLDEPVSYYWFNFEGSEAKYGTI